LGVNSGLGKTWGGTATQRLGVNPPNSGKLGWGRSWARGALRRPGGAVSTFWGLEAAAPWKRPGYRGLQTFLGRPAAGVGVLCPRADLRAPRSLFKGGSKAPPARVGLGSQTIPGGGQRAKGKKAPGGGVLIWAPPGGKKGG